MGISFKLKFFIDGVATLAGVVVVLGSYFGLITPRYHGFYCDDSKLKFVNTGDSLGLGQLFAIILIVPFVLIALVEHYRHRPFASERKLQSHAGSRKSSSAGVDLSPKYRRSLFWKCSMLMYRTYFNGLLCVCIIVEFLKLTIGGLRPHFFDSCRPDFTQINCSEGFITHYVCTKELPVWHHSDIFKSFPSGHAALSMYMSLFLCFYIYKNFISWPSVYLCSATQAFLVLWAIYCGCSRMMDHRHHWWDVLTGAVIGIVCSCHAAFLLCKIPPLCDTVCPLPKNCWSTYERPKIVLTSLSGNVQQTSFDGTMDYSLTVDESASSKLANRANHFEQMNSLE